MCSLPDTLDVFLQDANGKHYRHEARMELLVNSVDRPNIERRTQRLQDRSFIRKYTINRPVACDV